MSWRKDSARWEELVCDRCGVVGAEGSFGPIVTVPADWCQWWVPSGETRDFCPQCSEDIERVLEGAADE